jgi:hypothetical protein
MIFGGTQSQLLDSLQMTVIYRKIMNDDVEKLQIDLVTLREWAVENGTKINPSKRQLASRESG